ncbi:hypothetical protein EMCRGX_G033141 [Ephydatia muelleri]
MWPISHLHMRHGLSTLINPSTSEHPSASPAENSAKTCPTNLPPQSTVTNHEEDPTITLGSPTDPTILPPRDIPSHINPPIQETPAKVKNPNPPPPLPSIYHPIASLVQANPTTDIFNSRADTTSIDDLSKNQNVLSTSPKPFLLYMMAGNPSQSQEPQLPHHPKTSLVQTNPTTAKNFNFTMPRDSPPHVIPETQLTPNGVKDPPLPPPQELPSHEIQPLTE